MRELFTDGYNSLWHVIFGILTYYYSFIIVLYVLYQLMDHCDENKYIDILEYLLGLLFIMLVNIIKNNINK